MLKETRAILDLKIQRDKLHQYQKRVTTITNRETEIAKECLRLGNKQKALLALRRKKYQESLLAKTDQQLAQLQALTSDVEFALVQKDVLFGLQQGTAVLKEINKEIGGLEKVEMILSESEEARAYQEVGCASVNAEVLMLIPNDRKSMRCLWARCQTKMKMLSRTSWRPWSGRHNEHRAFQVCQRHPKLQLASCLMHLPRRQKSARKRDAGHERPGSRMRLSLLEVSVVRISSGEAAYFRFSEALRAFRYSRGNTQHSILASLAT